MLKENLTRNSSDHERIYLQLDTFLNQKLLDKEAMLVAMHLIGCEICLKRLADLLEAEKIFFLPLNPNGAETEIVQKQGLSRQVLQSFSFS